MKNNSELIRENVQKQNSRIDEKLKSLRGTGPLHWSILQPTPEIVPPQKLLPVTKSLAEILSAVTSFPSMPPLENLDVPPSLPPEFIFLHERVFLDGEIVENIDPDQIPDKPKKWWEDDCKYVESEGFDYSGDLSPEEKAAVWAEKWGKS